MDLEKLEKLAQLVLKDFNISYSAGNYSSVSSYEQLSTELKNLMTVAFQCLPAHTSLYTETYRKIDAVYGLSMAEAISIVSHLLKIIEIEKAGIEKTRNGRIFESAEDKLKEAGVCFRNDDYPSAFHCLNTSLELVLKDKLGIPTTITSINTSTIIDILVSQKIEPYLYLAEVKKHILAMDNKIKHQGYSPSKVDCINGMKAMEDLISKLRSREIEVSDEAKKKILEGL